MKRLKGLICRVLGHRKPRLFVGTMYEQRVTFTACPRCRLVFNAVGGSRRERRKAWRGRWKRSQIPSR